MAALACAPEPTVDAPDMRELVEAYERPTAELDGETLERALDQVLPLIGGIRGVGELDLVLRGIESVADGFVARGLDRELEANIDGRATVHVICPGFEREDEPDASRDGIVELTVPIERAALGPVAFGAARGCRFDDPPPASSLPGWLPELPDPFRGVLDGPISIHLGEPLVLGRELAITPLLWVEGELSIDGLPTVSDFDFRITGPQQLEVRLPVGRDAHAIVRVGSDSVIVRERRGTWTCDLDDGTACTPEF